MRWRFAILGLLIVAPAAYAQSAGDSDYAADEAILREQKLPTSGADLLQTLRDRTPSPQTNALFEKHVARLKIASYPERVKATNDLVKMGPLVRPLLENMLREGKLDGETHGRLEHVLDHFPAEKDVVAVTSTARLLQRDKPAGSLPVLLAYVPHAPDEFVRQEVQHAINAATAEGTEPATAVFDALKDANPYRRAAAAEALVRRGAKSDFALLTKDAHPQVRYQLGMAMVEKNNKAGLPLLINVLAELPPESADFALELLERAAGENVPTVHYEGKKNAAAFTAAWMKWHDAHQAKLDLAKQLVKSDMGFTIVGTMGIGAKARANFKGEIFEIGPRPENLRHWEFDGPRYPLDIQVLPNNRILIAEYLDNRVTERDQKGTVIKQFPLRMASICQRLPNGHTFMAGRQQILIVDRDGKETFSWTPQPVTIAAAQRMRTGQIAVATSDGRCRLLDPQGKELKSCQIGPIYFLGGSIEILPNGRILAPLYSQSQVAEFDWSGNKLWSVELNRPTSATRLANGNTLVTLSFENRIIELDKAGKEIWSYTTDSRPVRARRR